MMLILILSHLNCFYLKEGEKRFFSFMPLGAAWHQPLAEVMQSFQCSEVVPIFYLYLTIFSYSLVTFRSSSLLIPIAQSYFVLWGKSLEAVEPQNSSKPHIPLENGDEFEIVFCLESAFQKIGGVGGCLSKCFYRKLDNNKIDDLACKFLSRADWVYLKQIWLSIFVERQATIRSARRVAGTLSRQSGGSWS